MKTLTAKYLTPVAGLLLLAGLTFQTACKKEDLESGIPGYLYIDTIQLQTDEINQGNGRSAFTDAWVFVDNEPLGVFPLPATVPVLDARDHKISVRAGIVENGIDALRSAYPKLLPYDTTFTLLMNTTSTLSPRVRYLNSIRFVQLENFDGGSVSLESIQTNGAPIRISNANDPNNLDGAAGVVDLDGSQPSFQIATNDTFLLPTAVASYIELNYRCEVEFTVSVIVNTTGGAVSVNPLVTLRPTSVWKKVYINVSDLGGIQTNAAGYKLFLSGIKPASLAQASLYFDNIKVLY
jgi:hypothetical protein